MSFGKSLMQSKSFADVCVGPHTNRLLTHRKMSSVGMEMFVDHWLYVKMDGVGVALLTGLRRHVLKPRDQVRRQHQIEVPVRERKILHLDVWVVPEVGHNWS